MEKTIEPVLKKDSSTLDVLRILSGSEHTKLMEFLLNNHKEVLEEVKDPEFKGYLTGLIKEPNESGRVF